MKLLPPTSFQINTSLSKEIVREIITKNIPEKRLLNLSIPNTLLRGKVHKSNFESKEFLKLYSYSRNKGVGLTLFLVSIEEYNGGTNLQIKAYKFIPTLIALIFFTLSIMMFCQVIGKINIFPGDASANASSFIALGIFFAASALLIIAGYFLMIKSGRKFLYSLFDEKDLKYDRGYGLPI